MTLIEVHVKENDTADLLERALNNMKAALVDLTPMMQLANTSTVTRAIQDKCFNVLLPRSEEIDQVLVEILPNEKMPSALRCCIQHKRENQ